MFYLLLRSYPRVPAANRGVERFKVELPLQMSAGKHEDRDKSEKETEMFRIYLEDNGVMDAWTHILGELKAMPNRPHDPLRYITQKLGGICGQASDIQNVMIQELIHKVLTLESDVRIYASRNADLEEHVKLLEKNICAMGGNESDEGSMEVKNKLPDIAGSEVN